jgi:hypothetical protein
MSEPIVEKKESGSPPTDIPEELPPAAEPEKRKREYKEFGEEKEKATRMCPLFCSLLSFSNHVTDANVDMSLVMISAHSVWL